ncbi:hypothetical protein ABEW34_31765, partial [Paenibacillus algorifonticola]|uniref:hypothetical protein n=1 Tax=Paenibacillus algorifonticola TaxID=684063 RepID=UPI003D283474
VSKLQQYMREDEEELDAAGTEALEHLAYDREMSQVLQQVSAGASLEEDTKRLLEELGQGTLSIEQAIDQLTKTGKDSSEARKK